MGRLPGAWIAPHPVRELRELTRYRHKLVRARTSCKDQVHAAGAKLGIPVTCTDIFGVWGSTWLDGLELDQPYAGKVASLRKICALLAGEITTLDAAIASVVEHDQGYQAIGALPGIGPVLGAVIVAGIGEVTRFGRPGRLCSWAGLTPRHRSPIPKSAAGTSPSKSRGTCAGHWPGPSSTCPLATRCASARRTSSPAAATKLRTSPKLPWPTSCSPGSTTPCATARPDPWPPPRSRPRQQARTRAARDRWFYWPPPPAARPRL
jgi:transposase IS116/IS110/IS902 family protein